MDEREDFRCWHFSDLSQCRNAHQIGVTAENFTYRGTLRHGTFQNN